MKTFIHLCLTAAFAMIAMTVVSCAEKGSSGTEGLDCGAYGSAHGDHCHCNDGYFFDGATCVAPEDITDVCESEAETSDAGETDSAETEHDHTACVCPTEGECPCDGEISTYNGKDYCAPELDEE